MRWQQQVGSLLFLGALVCWQGCSDGGKRVTESGREPPVIISIDPDSAFVADTVQLLGIHFGASRGTAGRILFSTIDAASSSWSDTLIDAIVPVGAASGDVRVEVDGVASNSKHFNVRVPPPPPPVQITRLVPGRTVIVDTVLVYGYGFGRVQGASVVSFAGVSGSRVLGEIIAWADTVIETRVPPGAIDGGVRVQIAQTESAEKVFSVAPHLVEFNADVMPILRGYGCTDCHSGTPPNGGLSIESAETILRGDSHHGPVVEPRNGPGSIFVRKLGPDPPFWSRMPRDCSGQGCLNSSQILVISDWIDQGVRNN